MAALDDLQIRRYGRQILLDAVGGKGQRALLASEVVVALDEDLAQLAAAEIALLYLAGAGIGHLILTGAHRAPVRPEEIGMLLPPEDIGLPRGEAIARRLASLNPDVRVTFDAATERSFALSLDAAPPPDELLSSPPARALWRGSTAATTLLSAILSANRTKAVP